MWRTNAAKVLTNRATVPTNRAKVPTKRHESSEPRRDQPAGARHSGRDERYELDGDGSVPRDGSAEGRPDGRADEDTRTLFVVTSAQATAEGSVADLLRTI